MNEIDPGQFDDPALKAAVREVLGGETAPLSLRQRVAEQLTEARSQGQETAPRTRRLVLDRRTLGTALAACIALVAVGYMAMVVRENFFPPKPTVSSGP